MKNDHLSTPDPFETQLRSNLHRLADHAPTTVDLNTATAGDAYVASNDAMAGRDRRRRIASIGAIAAVLVGGAGLTIGGLQSASDPGGAKSPDEAVQQFAKALSNEDLLGMADMTVPEEAQALRVAATDAVSQAKRLDLLSQTFQLDGIAGVDVQIEGLTLADASIDAQLVAVTSTGGTMSLEADSTEIAFGDQARETMTTPGAIETTSVDLAEQPVTLVVQQRGDRWYISAGMSIAEQIRVATDQPMPADLGIVPEGSASPEAAASAFYGRIANLDLTGASGLLAPGEGDVFRRYAGLWMPGAEDGIASMKADGTEFKITTPIEYERVADSSGRVVLEPVRYGLDLTTPTYDVTTEDLTDPSLATLVMADNGQYVLPPGTALPASLDDPIFATAEFISDDDQEALEKVYSGETEYNYAYAIDGTAIENGMVSQVQGDVNGVETTHIEVADGCTTTTLPASAGSPDDSEIVLYDPSSDWRALFGMGLLNAEQLDDHTFRSCVGSSEQTGGLGRLWFFGTDDSNPLQLPSIVATENGGQWFVSPIGTLSELVIGPLRAAPDGASPIDIPMVSIMTGLPDRASFNQIIDAETGHLGEMTPECVAVTEKSSDGKTVLVADPDIKLYRECVENWLWSSESNGESITTEGYSSDETYSMDASDTSSGSYTYGVPAPTDPEEGAVVESATASQTSGG